MTWTMTFTLSDPETGVFFERVFKGVEAVDVAVGRVTEAAEKLKLSVDEVRMERED